MKKLFLAALAAGIAFGANAQLDVLKAAEKAQKSGKPFLEVEEMITPAFTNPETNSLAQTYFIPGKSAFDEYDHLTGIRAIKRTVSLEDSVAMNRDLLSGYKYYMKALPLDSVADAKGKVKTKYSKEIVNTIAGHYNDFCNIGVYLWDGQDYKGAYEAWNAVVALPSHPAFSKLLANAMPDSLLANYAYNQALAAWQAKMYPEALKSFDKAVELGDNRLDIYKYAVGCALEANDEAQLLRWSKRGDELFGKTNTDFIGNIVNVYLQKKDFDNAFAIINEAIGKNPGIAQYYVIRGVLQENKNDNSSARDDYRKASELDPQNAQALYYYGRQICNQAFELNDEAPTTQAEYTAFYNEKIRPLFEQAIVVLEDAYKKDQAVIEDSATPDYKRADAETRMGEVLNYLENIYYNLHDEAMLNDVKKRKSYL